MAYTRKRGSHAKVTIEGTDVSNAFSSLTRNSVAAQLPAGGFNTTGVAETVPGDVTQGFQGRCWYTEEIGAIVEPAHANQTVVTMTFQPDGLLDSTREVYTGEVYITEFSPTSTFGEVSAFDFVAVAADAAGITVNNWT